MAGNFIDLGYEGDRPAVVISKVQARVTGYTEALKRIAVDGARLAESVMESQAPNQSGALAARIESDEDAGYHAGGGVMTEDGFAPGGGVFEARAGVVDHPDGDYPLYVLSGTGYHATGTAIQGNVIRPLEGNVLAIPNSISRDTGKVSDYKSYQTGQEPQSAWVENAQLAANELVAGRIELLDMPSR